MNEELQRRISYLRTLVDAASSKPPVTGPPFPGLQGSADFLCESAEVFESPELSRQKSISEVKELLNRLEAFVPTPLQVLIWKVLDGRGLKKDALAHECCVDPRTLYKPGKLKELMETGFVRNKPEIGYFRPDSPPGELGGH